MSNQMKEKRIFTVPMHRLRKVVRQVVKEELRKALPLYYVDEDGVRISLVEENEDRLKLKPSFKRSLRKSLRQSKAGEGLSLEELRKKLKL